MLVVNMLVEFIVFFIIFYIVYMIIWKIKHKSLCENVFLEKYQNKIPSKDLEKLNLINILWVSLYNSGQMLVVLLNINWIFKVLIILFTSVVGVLLLAFFMKRYIKRKGWMQNE